MQIIDANFLAMDYQLLICLVTNYLLLKFGCWMWKSATNIPLLIKNSYPVQFQFQKFEIDSAKIKSNIKKIKKLIFLLIQNQTHIPTICPLLHFCCLHSFFVSIHIAKRGQPRPPEKALLDAQENFILISHWFLLQSQIKAKKTSTISLSPLSLNYLFRRSLEA